MSPYVGSLDSPPIVIENARWKLILALLGSAGFVTIGVWLAANPHGSLKAELIAPVCIAFFGLAGIATLVDIVRPNRVELSPSGLRFRSRFVGGFEAPWSAISDIQIWRVRSTRMVIFQLASPYDRQVRLAAINRNLTGCNATVGSMWTIGPDELAVLLQEAKARWG